MKISSKDLKKIERFVRDNIIDEYTWVHTQAVRKIAHDLAKTEGGDQAIIDLGALFHDIERGKKKNSGSIHAADGAKITKKTLQKYKFDQDTMDEIIHCVAAHSTPWLHSGPKPKTIEAKIVYDADMVQQVSPFGIVKHIHEFDDGNFDKTVKSSFTSIVKKIPVGIFTPTAKKMIKIRMPYIKDFFLRVRE